MAYPPITALPTAPDRNQPSTFSTRADALVAALATFVSETNASGDYIDGVGTAVDADAAAAAASASAASGSATAAAASATAAALEAAEWVSGASYTEGDVVWSPLDYGTYRAKTTHTGLTTDPSSDTTNWALVAVNDLAALGITASAAELNILDGVTASTAEINKLDGLGGDVVGTTDTQTLTNKTADGLTLNDGYTEEVFAVTGTTPALSPTDGSIQTWTLSGASTPTAGTWAAGQSITLMVDDGSAETIDWTSLSVVWKTDGGSAPTLNTSGDTVITLWKVSTTIYGARVGNA
jgi:hypothetical protein